MATTPDEPLSARVRAAARDAHQDVEHAPFVQDLLAGRLPVAGYARLAAQHHAIYAVLEDALATSTDPVLARFHVPELSRLSRIDADLVVLAGAGWRARLPTLPATGAYCARVRAACAGSPAGLLAHHYVRYLGELARGWLVGPILSRVFGLPDHQGTEFYRFPGVPSPRAFTARYYQLLDAVPWGEPDRCRLVQEVRVAYRLTADVLFALGPVPVLASGAVDRPS